MQIPIWSCNSLGDRRQLTTFFALTCLITRRKCKERLARENVNITKAIVSSSEKEWNTILEINSNLFVCLINQPHPKPSRPLGKTITESFTLLRYKEIRFRKRQVHNESSCVFPVGTNRYVIYFTFSHSCAKAVNVTIYVHFSMLTTLFQNSYT